MANSRGCIFGDSWDPLVHLALHFSRSAEPQLLHLTLLCFFFFFFSTWHSRLLGKHSHDTRLVGRHSSHHRTDGHEQWLKSLFCSWADKQEWEYSFRLTNCIAYLRYFLQFSHWSRRSVFKHYYGNSSYSVGESNALSMQRKKWDGYFRRPLFPPYRGPLTSQHYLCWEQCLENTICWVIHGLWKILSIKALCHRKQHLTDITFSTKWICSS